MQILKFRAAGLFPPVPAHERERWERDYGTDVRAFTKLHPININGPPPNERILKDWADWRQARAQQSLSAIDAPVDVVPPAVHLNINDPAAEPVAAVWPPDSDKTCPWCHRRFGYAMHLSRHMKACQAKPGPAA